MAAAEGAIKSSLQQTLERIESQLREGEEFITYGNVAISRSSALDLARRLRRYVEEEQ